MLTRAISQPPQEDAQYIANFGLFVMFALSAGKIVKIPLNSVRNRESCTNQFESAIRCAG
jgi:hypothetical protein